METPTPTTATLSIPLVDYGKSLHGSEAEQKEVAAQIDDAFRNVGFVYLINHGIPQERVDECFEWVFSLWLLIHEFTFYFTLILLLSSVIPLYLFSMGVCLMLTHF